MRRPLLFDLDDTLYEERSYVMSGFVHVAAALAAESGSDESELFTAMTEEFERHGRGKVFDRALERFGLSPTPDGIARLVQRYREHSPSIRFFDGVVPTLATLRAAYKLGVVTDGYPLMQQRKVDALGLEPHVDAIVYCWECQAPKPSPGGFLESLSRLDAKPKDAVIIGDDVIADLGAARALGCPFVRVRTGRFRNMPTPVVPVMVVEIEGVDELPDALQIVDLT